MAQQTAKSLKSKALSDLKSGKFPQAVKKAQLGAKKFPNDVDYHAIAGFALTQMERYRQSIPHFVEAARIKPEDAQFAENLANALMQTGQIPQALTYAEKKLRQFPNNSELTRVIDEIGMKGTNSRQIIDYTTQRLTAEPENPVLYLNRGRAYGRVGFLAQSSADYARAYKLAPDNTEIACQMAIDLRHSGDIHGSTKMLHDVLQSDSQHAKTLHQLATMADRDEAQELLNNVETAIAAQPHTDVDLEFAKAHLISRMDSLAAAMPQFARANTAQHQVNPYDPAAEEDQLNRIRNLFPIDNTLPESDETSTPMPVFVVGQPRSGTTLMEMMLSVVNEVFGCGELSLAGDLSRPFIDDQKSFNEQDAKAFARDYCNLMPPLPDGATAFIDKMPHNYQLLGFLAAAFPNAKFINILRDPRDVGLSKWTRRFPALGMRYSSNLGAIAHSANLYRQYMNHWDRIFGERIMAISYENLVGNPEAYSRKVAAFCGIGWTERMIHPEENTKQVRTASADQVRRAITTRSIGGWRKVEDHLKPMLDDLDRSLWPEYDLN
ncbi:tetratricopeptide repeat-containing sulfotransferase family protein [Ruegeria arenilitoris]|uniref:tetratricopeptide repeat-containing sulfotransferase family protein n=1 Tax=Ruegeria arenilitoris TaxID=1173585 RepID=UPI00147C9665|nr:sulfotransferase [Ruegeria arenilitoris]